MKAEKRRYFLNLGLFMSLVLMSTLLGWGIATFLAGTLMVLAFGLVLIGAYYAADDKNAAKLKIGRESGFVPAWVKFIYDLVVFSLFASTGHGGLAVLWAATFAMSLWVKARAKRAARIVSVV